MVESNNREVELMRRQAERKYSEYQKQIARLNAQIESSVLEFEEGKKNLKIICENKMNEKLLELAQTYETLLKMKDD